MANKKEQPETDALENVHDVLHYIQINLKAPRNQHNKFGGYNYRNCEDIFEGLKEVLVPNAHVTVSDEIIVVGNRVYIKSTACLEYKGKQIYNVAYAREPESKKGMDESQVTGASSSYARKYALNGLFLIDDVKDADADEKGGDKPDTKPQKTSETQEVKADSLPVFTQTDYEFYLESLAKCHDKEGLDNIAALARKNWKRMGNYQDKITNAINNKKLELSEVLNETVQKL